MKRIKKVFGDYGLSITLFILFLLGWIGQFISGWVEFVEEQTSFGHSVVFNEYLPRFLQSILENW